MTDSAEAGQNFKQLKKLLFQIGLPVLRDIFAFRYYNHHVSGKTRAGKKWQETCEFGEGLLKMLTMQNKDSEKLLKYEEKKTIESGKLSKWDYTVLTLVLTHIEFGNIVNQNRYDTENRMVHNLNTVRNHLAHYFWEEEKIPNEEFVKLWIRASDSLLYLGVSRSDLNAILGKKGRKKVGIQASGSGSSSGGRGQGQGQRQRPRRTSDGQTKGSKSNSNSPDTQKCPLKPILALVSSPSSSSVPEGEFSLSKRRPRISSLYRKGVLPVVNLPLQRKSIEGHPNADTTSQKDSDCTAATELEPTEIHPIPAFAASSVAPNDAPTGQRQADEHSGLNSPVICDLDNDFGKGDSTLSESQEDTGNIVEAAECESKSRLIQSKTRVKACTTALVICQILLMVFVLLKEEK